MKLTFELYTRTGCHLCEEMEREISILETELNFKVHVILINNDERLEARYGEKVPVLACGNDIICQYVLNGEALSKAIKRYT